MSTFSTLLCFGFFVQLSTQLIERLGQSFGISFNLVEVIALQGFFQGINSSLNLSNQLVLAFAFHVLHGLFSLIAHVVSLVAYFYALFTFFISFSVCFCFFNHSINFILIQSTGGGDGDFLLFAGAKVFSAYVNDTVGINVEGNFDFRYSTRCSRNATQLEAAQSFVVSSHFTFALQNMDINGGLVISSSGEYLFLRCRNGGVTINNLGEYTAEGFDTQRQRSYIQQQYVAGAFFAGQNASLNSSANSYAFIRVNAFVRLLAHEVFNSSLNSRDTRGTANQNYLADIALGQTCIAHSLANRTHSTFNKISSHSFEFCTSQVHIQMFWAISACGDERQVNVGAHNTGQLDFCFFSSLTQTLHSHFIGRQVNAFSFLEFINHPVHDFLIEVIAAQMSITIGCFYFKYTVANVQNGYVEGAAAKVIYHDGVVIGFINAVCQRCSSRLVDDTQNLKACNLASIFSSLTLAVVEVCRNSNNCLGYFFTQISFCVSLQLLQNHCGNFFRGIFFIINSYSVAAFAHMTFNGADGSVRIGNSLTFSQLTNKTLTIFCKANNGRGQTRALLVGDNGRFAAFHNGNNAISST